MTRLCGPCRVGNCAGHGRSFRDGQLEPCDHGQATAVEFERCCDQDGLHHHDTDGVA